MYLNYKTIQMWKIYLHLNISRSFHSTSRFCSQVTNLYKNSPTLLQQKIEKEQKYLQPYMYIRQVEGKMVNTKIFEGLNVWLDIPKDKLNQIIDIGQTLREMTSCVDDVLDNSRMRRTIPSANMIFSTESIISTSFYLYTLVLDTIADLGHPDAQKIAVKHLSGIFKGEALEIFLTDQQNCPSEEEFEECLSLRTGASLGLPLALMELFSKRKYNLQPFFTNLCRYIQILDDLIDLNQKTNKQYSSDDISAGRYSFPIIHALRNNPDDYQIKRILSLKTQDNDVKQQLVSLLEKYGSIEHTRKTLNILDKKVFEELHKLEENPIMVDVMNCFRSTANYLDK